MHKICATYTSRVYRHKENLYTEIMQKNEIYELSKIHAKFKYDRPTMTLLKCKSWETRAKIWLQVICISKITHIIKTKSIETAVTDKLNNKDPQLGEHSQSTYN